MKKSEMVERIAAAFSDSDAWLVELEKLVDNPTVIGDVITTWEYNAVTSRYDLTVNEMDTSLYLFQVSVDAMEVHYGGGDGSMIINSMLNKMADVAVQRGAKRLSRNLPGKKAFSNFNVQKRTVKVTHTANKTEDPSVPYSEVAKMEMKEMRRKIKEFLDEAPRRSFGEEFYTMPTDVTTWVKNEGVDDTMTAQKLEDAVARMKSALEEGRARATAAAEAQRLRREQEEELNRMRQNSWGSW